MSARRLIFCSVSYRVSPAALQRLGVPVDVVLINAAREDPLGFQAAAADAACVVSDARVDEEVRALCGDFADVIALPVTGR